MRPVLQNALILAHPREPAGREVSSVFGWLGRLMRGPYGAVLEHAVAQPRASLPLPANVNLGGGEVLLREMAASDGPGILAFANALPAHDLLFLRRDITRPDQVDAWLHEAATGQIATVFALQGDQIVGYASVASEGLTWTRHVRELRVMVAESMRGQHLGRILTEEAFAIAREQGAKKMIAQMTVDQQGAINVFQRLGFEPEARLRGQVMDRDGHVHDLQIMGLDIEAFQSKLDAALTSALPPT